MWQEVFAARTDVSVFLDLECEVIPREISLFMPVFVQQGHMRLDPLAVYQPADGLGIALCAVPDEAFRIKAVDFFNPI